MKSDMYITPIDNEQKIKALVQIKKNLWSSKLFY